MSRKCPICGSPHDTLGGVAVHLWKKQDSDHEHIKSKDGGLEWLAREGHIGGDTSTDTSDPVDAEGADTETATATDGGATTLQVPNDSENTAADDSGETPPRAVACPSCDRTPDTPAVFDSDEYLRKAGDRLAKETHEAIARHDLVCTECWKGFDS